MSKLYQNKWAGYETYFTPTFPVRTRKGEADVIGGYEITKVNGKWECRKGQCYAHSLRDEEQFPVVGNVKINILGYVMGAMLDALEEGTEEGYIGTVKGIVDGMPTIEERKTGKWIKISPAGIYECSECGQNVMTSDIDVYRWCHGCGRRMGEGEQE